MVAAGVDFKDRLVTLFDSDCDDGVSAGIWAIHSGHKSGGELVTPVLEICFGPPTTDFVSIRSSQKVRKF